MSSQYQILEDKASEEEYFQFLRAELVQQISTQLGESKKLIDGFLQQLSDNTPDDFSWIWDEAPTESAQKKKAIFELRERLSDRAVIVTGIQFPASDTELKGEYQRLLSSIPSLELWRCDFYGGSLLPDQEACITYSNCTFHNNWKITASRSKDADQPLFEQCCFKQKVQLVEGEPGFCPVSDYAAIFGDGDLAHLVVQDTSLDAQLIKNRSGSSGRVEHLTLKNCRIQQKLSVSNTENIQRVELLSTVFEDKFALINCKCDTLTIKNTNFNGLADFYQSQFESVRIQKSIFRDFAGFEDCCFGKTPTDQARIVPRYVTFYSFINFRSAIFNQALDLRNTNRQQQPNFLDAKFSGVAAKATDRETFRIIKHSFDAVGNHIEAGKYYAYEMQAYRRELKNNATKANRHYRERSLLALNSAFSSHGQNYLGALRWLLIAVAVNAAILANHKYHWVLLPESWQVPMWQLAGWLNGFANGFLPLRALLGEDLESLAFWVLMAAVVISTLTWHLLMAMRRHSRR